MSKVISSILPLVGTFIGAAVGTAILGPGIGTAIGSLIGNQLGSLAGSIIYHPPVAKPETTETSVKTERPVRVRAYGSSRLYGASICYETVNGKTIDVWAFHDGRASAITRTYLNDNQVTRSGNVVNALADKSYQGGNVTMGYSLGLPTETAFSAVTALLPAWDASHRGDGVVCGWLIKNPEKDKYLLETYPQGDNVQLSLVGNWLRVYDPRQGGQDPYHEDTWAWSDNAVLAFVHYLMTERGYDWNTRFAPQLAKLLTAINIADEDVTLAAGGTEKRYRTALSYKATEEPASVIASLLACFDGWYCLNERGEVIVYAGAYYEPTVTIDASTISSWRQPMGVAAEDIVNQIAIPYVSSLHDYGTVDGDAWRDEDSIAALGRENTAELGAVVPSHTQGRRLAKIKMARNNAGDRGTITTTYGGRAVLEQRFIALNITEAGATFFNGVAEIIGAERDPNTGGVTFDWVAADANAWAWNPATEDGQGAPVGNRIAAEPLDPPTINSAAPVYAESTDAGTGVRIAIEATGPALAGLTWYARWRKDSTSPWNEQDYPDVDPGASVSLLTGFVPVSAGLQVEVEYRASDGRLSGWSEPAGVDSRTDTTAPDAATTITVTSWSDALNVVTDRIARASSYRWRFYASDGTTLVRTIVTTAPQASYTSSQAAIDGARRAYVVKVAGVNSAGAGGEVATGTVTLPAPVAVTGVDATGGAYEATVAFDLSTNPAVAGYLIPYANVASFDPLTQGTITRNLGSSPHYLQGLAAGTFYTKVAAYDAWTDRPDLLNFSAEDSFAITTGGGGSGGGGGGGGGGYCPEIALPILMANEARNGPGPEKAAGDLVAGGDWVWTRPELENGTLGDWGAYPVSAVDIVEADVVRTSLGIRPWRGTPNHRIWLTGFTEIDAFGVSAGRALVAKITVETAHTYFGNGILHHNIKAIAPGG